MKDVGGRRTIQENRVSRNTDMGGTPGASDRETEVLESKSALARSINIHRVTYVHKHLHVYMHTETKHSGGRGPLMKQHSSRKRFTLK